MKKLKAFDLSYFIGKSQFEEDGTQNYLPVYRYFTVFSITQYVKYVSEWKCKGLSSETLRSISASDSLNPTLSYYDTKIRVNFTGSCLKQPTISYTHGKVVNIYIFYELGASGSNNSDPTLKNYLFGAVTLTKNADFEKYGYSGYEIGFDRRPSFSFPGGEFGQNVLIFGVDICSSAYIGNKKEVILVPGKGPTQRLEHTLTAEKCIQLILLLRIKNFV